jgi:uridine kinase
MNHHHLQDASSNNKKCFIIGVAGGSSAGKKALCSQIKSQLQCHFSQDLSVLVLHAENFYRPLSDEAGERKACEEGRYNFDTPNAYDFELLAQTLTQFKSSSQDSSQIAIPHWDLESHTRSFEVLPGGGGGGGAKPRVLLVEGIFVLYDRACRDLIDMKVFVDVESDVRLSARVVKERAAHPEVDLEQILGHYMRFVKPGFDDFIFPTKKWADIVVPRGIENQVAVDLIGKHILGILQGKHDGIPSFSTDTLNLMLFGRGD